MPRYRVTAPDGRWKVVRGDRPPSPEEQIALFQQDPPLQESEPEIAPPASPAEVAPPESSFAQDFRDVTRSAASGFVPGADYIRAAGTWLAPGGPETYSEAVAQEKERSANINDQMPYVDLAARLVGGFTSPLAKVGGGLGLMGQGIVNAPIGAIEGAAAAPVGEDAKGGLLGAVLGLAGPTIGEVLGMAVSGVGKLGGGVYNTARRALSPEFAKEEARRAALGSLGGALAPKGTLAATSAGEMLADVAGGGAVEPSTSQALLEHLAEVDPTTNQAVTGLMERRAAGAYPEMSGSLSPRTQIAPLVPPTEIPIPPKPDRLIDKVTDKFGIPWDVFKSTVRDITGVTVGGARGKKGDLLDALKKQTGPLYNELFSAKLTDKEAGPILDFLSANKKLVLSAVEDAEKIHQGNTGEALNIKALLTDPVEKGERPGVMGWTGETVKNLKRGLQQLMSRPEMTNQVTSEATPLGRSTANLIKQFSKVVDDSLSEITTKVENMTMKDVDALYAKGIGEVKQAGEGWEFVDEKARIFMDKWGKMTPGERSAYTSTAVGSLLEKAASSNKPGSPGMLDFLNSEEMKEKLAAMLGPDKAGQLRSFLTRGVEGAADPALTKETNAKNLLDWVTQKAEVKKTNAAAKTAYTEEVARRASATRLGRSLMTEDNPTLLKAISGMSDVEKELAAQAAEKELLKQGRKSPRTLFDALSDPETRKNADTLIGADRVTSLFDAVEKQSVMQKTAEMAAKGREAGVEKVAKDAVMSTAWKGWPLLGRMRFYSAQGLGYATAEKLAEAIASKTVPPEVVEAMGAMLRTKGDDLPGLIAEINKTSLSRVAKEQAAENLNRTFISVGRVGARTAGPQGQ